MTAPLPDPRLLKVMTELDAVKRELRAEKIRASNLRRRVEQLVAQNTTDAKPKPDRHAGC